MKNIQKDIAVIVLFVIITLFFTFPLVFHTTEYIPAFSETTEPLSILNDFWWMKFASQKGLDFYSRGYIAAPYGVPFDKKTPNYPVWDFINKYVTLKANGIFTYNLNVLLSYVLAGIFMYLAILYITQSRLAAVFSGIIYTFSLYHAVRAWQHLGLAHIEWLSLYILALLKLKNNANTKNTLFAALALFLVFSFDFYYAYFSGIITLIFVFFLLIYGFKEKIRRKNGFSGDLALIKGIIACFFITLLFLSPVIISIFKEMITTPKLDVHSAYTAYHRPFEDLFSQSAKILSYLLPATVHPLFGKFTEQFVGSSLYGNSYTEHALYLGWTPLILAFFAVKKWKKHRKPTTNDQRLTTKDDFFIGFFIFLTIAAWLFSQPPWWKIGPIKIYMPSFFMYKIFPMFRAYCRFGIIVMLGIAGLAGFGLKFILEKFKTQQVKIAIAALFCGLVLFEFWNWPAYKVIDLSQPPAAYDWLKAKNEDIVIAEYPLDSKSPNEMYKFFQTKHEKKMINGTIPGTQPNQIAKAIARLSDSKTAETLSWMKVKYVLVHKEEYLKTELIEDKNELDKIPQNKGLKLMISFPLQECPQTDTVCVRKTGPIDVYEVTASPVEPKIKD